MKVFFISIFVIIITLLSVLSCLIIDEYIDNKRYKNKLKNLKIGNLYSFTIKDENPFFCETVTVEVIDIKYDNNNIPWVKFKNVNNNNINTTTAKNFLLIYNCNNK